MNYIDYANPKEITLYNGNDLKKYLSGEDFVFLGIIQFPREILFSVKTGMLWTAVRPKLSIYACNAGGLKEWVIPSISRLVDFVNLPNNPYCSQIFPFLNGNTLFSAQHSHYNNYIYGHGADRRYSEYSGLYCSEVLKNKTWQEGFDFLQKQSLQITTLRNEVLSLYDESLIPDNECGESDPTTLKKEIGNCRYITIVNNNQEPEYAIWDLETNLFWSFWESAANGEVEDLIKNLAYELYNCKLLGIKKWKLPDESCLDKSCKFTEKNNAVIFSRIELGISCTDYGCGNIYFVNNFFQDKTWEQRAYFIEKYWKLEFNGKVLFRKEKKEKSEKRSDDRIG